MPDRSILWAAAALAILSAGPATAACQYVKIAEVPVTMEGMRPTIMTQINGQDARMAVSTGSFFGGVNPEAAAKYGMKHTAAPFGMLVQGIGGVQRSIAAVSAESFSFAGMGFKKTDFLLLDRAGGTGTAGDIGENLMGGFDVEYDFANGMMRYFRATGCGFDTNLAYWSQGMAVSRLSLVEPTPILSKVIANAKVDGHNIRVSFSSAGGLSMLSRPAAARAGITVASEGVSPAGVAYGTYGKGLETFLAPFASFAIGDEEIKNTRLRIANLELPASDMVLGADFFLSHRILISSSQKRVYFTYNGGPVFRLDGAAKPLQARADAAPGAAAPAPAETEPKTGSEFARRAAAEVARREYPQAVSDYSRAVELEPDNGAYYRARGMARVAARQPVLAMADLDEALKRQPNDPEALMRRGELYLASRDEVRGKADFEAAMKLAPTDTALVEQAGAAYTRAGLYELAIQKLDTWIAAHPKDENLPRTLSTRCYARAAWGKELEKALADCDAAIRKDKTSSVMLNRGLVFLRMGRFDEAASQYADVIKVQPRAAPALYGRGLAELRKGAKAEGEADIAAARAIAPAVGDPFKRFGLTPDEAPAAKS